MMDDTNVTVVASLDAKIRETEAELEEAKASAARLPILSERLEHLQKVRALYPNSASPATSPSTEPDQHPSEATGTARSVEVDNTFRTKGKPIPGSMGHRMIQVLREIPNPAFIRDIQKAMESEGSTVNYNNLASQLSQYVKRGWVTRPRLGYYSLPRQASELNGGH
jgi:hypothetical protein